MRKVEVVPHNPDWRSQFMAESQTIATALGSNVITIHHIGSTAIPGIYAKPIIDLLVEVESITQMDQQVAVMQALGYEAMGEYGIPGRRYFRKHNAEGDRTHHAHAFQTGSPEIKRHLIFRDYLIAHPADAQAYSELKQQLAKQHPHDIEAYMDGKDGLIQAIAQRAAQFEEFCKIPTGEV
ncbi:MAG: GrpB family protein [Leptolyngbyaceae cyanobacterium bins.302]|nr:GrpB family protein [Leptolyngbyaceae cyanobacterium bins.302]